MNPSATAVSEFDGVTRLSVTRLSVSRFRNYAEASLSCDGRPVVLIGPNGAGKTNLLEAISLLVPGRGLRRAKPGELDQRVRGQGVRIDGVRKQSGQQGNQAGPWAVAAEIDGPMGSAKLGTGRDPDSERRMVRINGAPARGQVSLGEWMSAVWLTPQMDGLFIEGPGDRRRFIDRLIFGFDPAHAGRVSGYEQALRQRARLLKESGPRADPAWLAALEAQMVERGIAIAAARRDMAARLDRACARAEGPFPGARVSVSGAVADWLSEGSAAQAEERFAAALAAGRTRDAEQGGAVAGPHRDDLTVRHLVKDMPAENCSTGEQKALLIALVLAHVRLQAAERGTVPVVLLDEVAAHLDEERRQALFEGLLELGAQTWITGTEAAPFEGFSDRAQRFSIEAANISAI